MLLAKIGQLNEKIENVDGASAYELAQEDGYEGTLTEWLESLKSDVLSDDRVNTQNRLGIDHSLLKEELNNDNFEGVDLFSINDRTVQNPEGGNSAYYRIPALTVTEKGTIIVFTDVRYDTANDNAGRIAIWSRRSKDFGKTWEAPIRTANFPTLEDGITPTSTRARTMDSTVISSESGRVLVLNGCWKTNSGNWTTYNGTPDPDWLLGLSISDSDGETWSTRYINKDGTLAVPSDIVSALGGVGSGIQMIDGTLVFPIQCCRKTMDKKSVVDTIIYSKDDGATWTWGRGYTPPTGGEANVTEIAPGTLLMNCRQGLRKTFVSKNMGATWEVYQPLNDKINNRAHGCMGSSIKALMPSGKEVYLHTSPQNKTNSYSRDSITLYASYDYETIHEIKNLYPKSGNGAGAGYSCLASTVINNRYYLFWVYERQGNIAFRNLSAFIPLLNEEAIKNSSSIESELNFNKKSVIKLVDKFQKGELANNTISDNPLLYNLESTLKLHLGGVEDGRVIDISGNNNDFAVEGNIEIDERGYYTFHNTREERIYSTTFLPKKDFTIDFDVFVKGAPGVSWSFFINLMNRGGGYPSLGLGYNGEETWNPVASNYVSQTIRESGGLLGKHYHFSIVHSSQSGVTFYKNGEAIWAKTDEKAKQSLGGEVFTIGNNSLKAKALNGKIGNVKVYDKVAGEIELQHLYAISIAGQEHEVYDPLMSNHDKIKHLEQKLEDLTRVVENLSEVP